MGKPSPGIDLAILNTENERVIDEEGEISVLITPTSENFIFQGYRKNVAGKAQLIRPERIDTRGQRWYSTGDRAIMDQEGYLWYVGRDDDVINSSGYRIGPFEVESALKVLPTLPPSELTCVGTPFRGRVRRGWCTRSNTPYHRQGICGVGPGVASYS
jgi:medium-chain acyl-CoA synthetase